MGAKVTVQDRCAHIQPSVLHANRLRSPDLRGGAALLVAALAADGITRLTELHHLDRGYEDPVGCLCGVGAAVCRI